MSILEEIKIKFSSIKPNTIIEIKNSLEEYKFYIIRTFDNYGVAVEYLKDDEIYEVFSNAKLETIVLRYEVDNEFQNKKFLYFNSSNFTLRNEFAVICKHFVDPGKNGENRKSLLNSPFEWWESWKSLLGNAERNINSYSILAELLVLKHLYQKYKDIQWTAISNGTHDFETEEFSVEVKSTLKKYDLTISINSQNQLHSEKPIYLYFCRFEKSSLGICINDVVKKLVDLGYSSEKLENQLSLIGFKRGKKARTDKYVVRDKRKFIIDERFPKVSIEDINDEHIRSKILKLVYTIDLGGIEYSEW